MGYTSYSTTSRAHRAETMNFTSAISANLGDYLQQNKERRAHDSMLPSLMKGFREARDSEAHPTTIPIQLYIDVTGSMGNVPAYLIREGLTKIVSQLIEAGLEDVTLMLGAVGDHEYDYYPLQIGQFESGDEELDMWLTRIYMEGGGGGNAGESYALAWYQGAKFTRTDAWEKRKQKGFIITIGDEPVLTNYPGSALKEIWGDNLEQPETLTAQEILDEVRKTNHLLHVHFTHGGYRNPETNLKKMLGQSYIIIDEEDNIAKVIVKFVTSSLKNEIGTIKQIEKVKDVKSEFLNNFEITL